MEISIQVSVGEALDRLSILRIKGQRIASKSAQVLIHRDISMLQDQLDGLLTDQRLAELFDELLAANSAMWNSMQFIYDWDGARTRDFEDVLLAIIEDNKERARVKRQIDELCGSQLKEVKSFIDDQ